MPRTLESEQNESVFIVTPTPQPSDLKASNVDEDLPDLLEQLDNAKGKRVLVDLGNLKLFGTAMMRVLAALYKRVSADNQLLALCNVADSCRKVLKTARFDIFCTTYGSRTEALAALSEDVLKTENAAFQRFTIEQTENAVILRLVDSQLSDLALHGQFRDELLRLVEEQQPVNVLVNFAAVKYCTTGVVESLLRAKKRLAAGNGQLKLCELSKLVYEAFNALNLIGTVFRVYETEAEALYAFSQEGNG